MRTTVKAMHLGKPIVWQVEDITHCVGLLPCGRTRMPVLRRYLKERSRK